MKSVLRAYAFAEVECVLRVQQKLVKCNRATNESAKSVTMRSSVLMSIPNSAGVMEFRGTVPILRSQCDVWVRSD